MILERELEENGILAKHCVKALKLDKSKWYSVRNLVRVRLNRVRNNAQQCVRKKLKRYFEENGVDSINLQRVLEGRRNRETFHWFLDHIASAIIGTRLVDQVKSIKSPSEWLTRSLEAFSLLCLENFFEMTRNQVLHKDSRQTYQALWTADGRGKQKNQGWSPEGIRRYNVLCRAVEVDRENYRIEDEVYLNTKRQEQQTAEKERLKRREERTEIREQGLEAADDDFSYNSDTEDE